VSAHWYYRKCSDCGVRYRSVMPQILKRELCDPCDLRAEADAAEEMDRLQREAAPYYRGVDLLGAYVHGGEEAEPAQPERQTGPQENP
jgi:hypothetical protein